MNALGRGHNPYEFMLGRTPEMDALSLMNDRDVRDMKIWILPRQRFLEVDADQKLARLLNARGRTVK